MTHRATKLESRDALAAKDKGTSFLKCAAELARAAALLYALLTSLRIRAVMLNARTVHSADIRARSGDHDAQDSRTSRLLKAFDSFATVYAAAYCSARAPCPPARAGSRTRASS